MNSGQFPYTTDFVTLSAVITLVAFYITFELADVTGITEKRVKQWRHLATLICLTMGTWATNFVSLFPIYISGGIQNWLFVSGSLLITVLLNYLALQRVIYRADKRYVIWSGSLITLGIAIAHYTAFATAKTNYVSISFFFSLLSIILGLLAVYIFYKFIHYAGTGSRLPRILRRVFGALIMSVTTLGLNYSLTASTLIRTLRDSYKYEDFDIALSYRIVLVICLLLTSVIIIDLRIAWQRAKLRGELYTLIMAHHPDIVNFLDVNGRIISVSQGTERLTGQTAAEMAGMPFVSMIAPEDREKSVKQFHSLMKNNKETLELNIRHKDGQDIPISSTGIRVVVEDRLVGLIALGKDIREQKLLQIQLQNRKLLHRSLFEQSLSAIFWMDAECKFLKVNSAGMQLTGYNLEELISRSLLDLIVFEDQERIAAWRDHLQETPVEAGYLSEFAVMGKQQNQVHLLVNLSPIIIERQLVGIYAIADDISYRKQLETMAANNYDSFLDIFNNMTEAAFLFQLLKDGNKILLEVNDSACEKLQVNRAQLIATPFEQLKAFLLTDEQLTELYTKGKLRIFTDFLNNSAKKLKNEVVLILLHINDKQLVLVLSHETSAMGRTAESSPQQDPGKKLQMVMVDRNMSTSELATQTGLSMATISNLRTGKIKKPQSLTAQLICETLQVDMYEIWNQVEK